MRVFVTGASGFIGSAVVKELLQAGHQVTGLARSEASAKALLALGAQVHRGSLQDLDSLRSGAAASEGVIHLAFIHAFSDGSVWQRLRVLLSLLWGGVVTAFVSMLVDTDRAAVEAMGEVLAGSNRPLVVAFGTMAMRPGRIATEQDEADPASAGGARGTTEAVVLGLKARGVRACVVRLPPTVHGAGDKAFIPHHIKDARKSKSAAYIGDGSNRWPAVHRLDAAVLFRLVLEKGAAGARYHAVADQGVPFKDVAAVIGRRLNVPAVSVTEKAAEKRLGFLARFFAVDNPVSAAWTQQQLDWKPTQPSLLADLDTPEYYKTQ